MRILLLCLAIITHTGYAAVSVMDFEGRQVSLDKPAQRIIALAPHIVENIYSAGAGELLVGAVSYSDFPEAAKQIPRVGSYQAWSLESIVALQPDLILMWGSGNGMDTLPALERLGLTVFVSEPRELEDIAYMIRAIGQLAGTVTQSEAEAQRIEQGFAQLRREYQREPPLSVFYQVWNQPLQTLNGEHLISDVIELCGGTNVFSDAAFLAPRISVEAVLDRDPDIILASGMDEARPEWLDDWQQYPSLSAVQQGRLFFVHPDHIQRPTARILLGAQRLCEQVDSVPR
jgi:iron complex transport system substrate-binding protein